MDWALFELVNSVQVKMKSYLEDIYFVVSRLHHYDANLGKNSQLLIKQSFLVKKQNPFQRQRQAHCKTCWTKLKKSFGFFVNSTVSDFQEIVFWFLLCVSNNQLMMLGLQRVFLKIYFMTMLTYFFQSCLKHSHRNKAMTLAWSWKDTTSQKRGLYRLLERNCKNFDFSWITYWRTVLPDQAKALGKHPSRSSGRKTESSDSVRATVR